MKTLIKNIRDALYDMRVILEEERNNIQAAIDMGYRDEIKDDAVLLGTYNAAIRALKFLS